MDIKSNNKVSEDRDGNITINRIYTYSIFNRIGSGSYSRVYKGINNETLESIAVKVMDNMNKHVNKIIRDEINMMNEIKNNPHPNIVECFDVISFKEKTYIIMEYCDSGDLRSIMKKNKPIQEKFVQFYFSQLSNGLKYLDNLGIAHRDIKPKNILLTNKRKVLKIADFGFAKQPDENDLYNTICGSPMYMAPEITRFEYYNKKSDIWSLGLIMFEMLYGFHPYHHCKSQQDLQDAIDFEDISIPPNNNKNPKISTDCIELVKVMLEKNSSQRISWDGFFEHVWVNKYKCTENYTCYREKINSFSVGSLNNNYADEMEDIVIIDNYMDNLEFYNEIDKQDNYDIDNSLMFEMEF